MLGGDFNLPDITWSDEGCGCRTMTRLNAFTKKPMIVSSVFTQHVIEPRRRSNILDVFLCNRTDIVNRVDVILGMGDHDDLIVTLDLKKKKTHEVR